MGGGAIAARKIRSLLAAGARVTVTAAEAHEKIKKLGRSGKILWRKRKFALDDLRQKNLVICATDSPELNAKVSEECAARRIWVNVVDAPRLCSFIAPAIVSRGEVTLAISTGGASPALAKFLRKKIEKILTPKIASLSKILKKKRPQLLNLSFKKRKEVIKKLLKEGISKN